MVIVIAGLASAEQTGHRAGAITARLALAGITTARLAPNDTFGARFADRLTRRRM